jgi:hypothetical protein
MKNSRIPTTLPQKPMILLNCFVKIKINNLRKKIEGGDLKNQSNGSEILVVQSETNVKG